MNKKSCRIFAQGYVKLQDGRVIHIDDLQKILTQQDFGELMCPDYGNRIKFVKRLKGRPYASHKGKGSSGNKGVSALHIDCIAELKKALEKLFPGIKWETEKVFPAIRKEGLRKIEPDLIGEIPVVVDGEVEFIRLAIEIQKSDMSSARFIERTQAYHDRGFVILWIKPVEGPISKRYSPKITERLIHALNFGVTFYWQRGFGANLLPVQYLHIPGQRRTKKLVAGGIVSIADFIVKKREKFTPTDWNRALPECRIFVPGQLSFPEGD